MIFTADIGNTNIVIGIYDGTELVHSLRLETDARKTTDEYAGIILFLLSHKDIKASDITGVIISSVVPQVVYTFGKLARKYFDTDPIVVGPGIKTGVPIRMENPKEVGADRIVNAAAAIALFGTPAIVVDFGTATTFDVIDSDGAFVGGLICPGVKLAASLLHSRTAKLPEVEIEKPDAVVGSSTVHAIQSGIFYGYLTMIDGLIDKIVEERFSGMRPAMVATGGLGSVFASESAHGIQYEPNLTLEGLRIIYGKNA